MVTAISAIIVFLLLILVHEFGHFIIAKSVGIRVLEFAIGMGPAIFKKQKGETLYSIRIFPIGGFCKMEGEDEESDDERSFGNKKIWQRFLVLVAGATMNIITGFIIFLIIMSTQQQISIPAIDLVTEGFPAQQAGLLPGDRIVSLDNTRINIQNDYHFQMSRHAGGDIRVGFERDGVRNFVNITPAQDERGRYILGFKEATEELTIAKRITTANYLTLFTSKVIVISLGDLITGRYSYKEMSGPVGIVQHIGDAAKTGVLDLLSLTALISINLGVFNLLPIPALDGGRVLFLIVEAVRRKKLPADKEGIVHFVGFALLILLMIFATTNDIGRLIGR